jgi:hypothetical protein
LTISAGGSPMKAGTPGFVDASQRRIDNGSPKIGRYVVRGAEGVIFIEHAHPFVKLATSALSRRRESSY